MMKIDVQGYFGKRMTWIPDPPRESKVTDMGMFYDSTLFNSMNHRTFLLPTLFSSLIVYG
jgi:hypothetical protein